jgi:hypothetical protein
MLNFTINSLELFAFTMYILKLNSRWRLQLSEKSVPLRWLRRLEKEETRSERPFKDRAEPPENSHTSPSGMFFSYIGSDTNRFIRKFKFGSCKVNS